MAQAIFQAKLSLQNITQLDAEMLDWSCDVIFSDADGAYTGYDVRVNDVLAVDTGGMEPGSFTLYTVVQINSQDFTQLTLTVRYADVNNNLYGPPDLSSFLGSDCMISRPSTNFGLLPVVSRDQQGMSDKFTEYAQNYNFVTVLDKLLAIPKSASFNKTNNDSITLLKGMPVVLEPLNENLMIRAYPSGATARVVGLVSDTVLMGAVGPVISVGQIEQPTTMWDALTGDVGGLTAGKDYFLRGDYLGGLSKTPPTTGFIVKLGKAVSSTILDVDVETPIEL